MNLSSLYRQWTPKEAWSPTSRWEWDSVALSSASFATSDVLRGLVWPQATALEGAIEGMSHPQVLGLYVPALRKPQRPALGTRKHALWCLKRP